MQGLVRCVRSGTVLLLLCYNGTISWATIPFWTKYLPIIITCLILALCMLVSIPFTHDATKVREKVGTLANHSTVYRSRDLLSANHSTGYRSRDSTWTSVGRTEEQGVTIPPWVRIPGLQLDTTDHISIGSLDLPATPEFAKKRKEFFQRQNRMTMSTVVSPRYLNRAATDPWSLTHEYDYQDYGTHVTASQPITAQYQDYHDTGYRLSAEKKSVDTQFPVPMVTHVPADTQVRYNTINSNVIVSSERPIEMRPMRPKLPDNDVMVRIKNKYNMKPNNITRVGGANNITPEREEYSSQPITAQYPGHVTSSQPITAQYPGHVTSSQDYSSTSSSSSSESGSENDGFRVEKEGFGGSLLTDSPTDNRAPQPIPAQYPGHVTCSQPIPAQYPGHVTDNRPPQSINMLPVIRYPEYCAQPITAQYPGHVTCSQPITAQYPGHVTPGSEEYTGSTGSMSAAPVTTVTHVSAAPVTTVTHVSAAPVTTVTHVSPNCVSLDCDSSVSSDHSSVSSDHWTDRDPGGTNSLSGKKSNASLNSSEMAVIDALMMATEDLNTEDDYSLSKRSLKNKLLPIFSTEVEI